MYPIKEMATAAREIACQGSATLQTKGPEFELLESHQRRTKQYISVNPKLGPGMKIGGLLEVIH